MTVASFRRMHAEALKLLSRLIVEFTVRRNEWQILRPFSTGLRSADLSFYSTLAKQNSNIIIWICSDRPNDLGLSADVCSV